MSDQYGTGNLGGSIFKPIANDSDSPSFVTGPIQTVVPDYVAKGHHKKHAHPDADLCPARGARTSPPFPRGAAGTGTALTGEGTTRRGGGVPPPR